MKRYGYSSFARWVADYLLAVPAAALLLLCPTITAADHSIPDYVDTAAFNEVDFNMQGRYPLPTTMTLARTDEPNPVVIIYDGFSLRDRNESLGDAKPFQDIAWGLATQGIASIRFDTRAYTLGPDTVAQFGLDEYLLNDISDLIAFIRAQPNLFDTTRIFIAGHGLGGYVAPLIAERDTSLAGIILLSALARPPHEALLSIAGGPLPDSPEKNFIKDRAQSLINRLADRELPPDQIVFFGPARLWYNLMDSSGVEVAKNIDVPFLVVQGGRDEQVGAKDFAIWKNTLKDNDDITFVEYENLNHLYQPESESIPGVIGSQENTEPVDKRVIDVIADWINGKP